MSDPHIYEPLDWQKASGYRVALTTPSGKPQCRHSVHRRDGWGFAQCTKPGVVQVDGLWFCAIHDPVATAHRDAETATRQKAAYDKKRLEWRGPLFARALREIADGHNDPRELARQTLGDLYDAVEPQVKE